LRPDLPTSEEGEDWLRQEKLRAAPRERDPEVSERFFAKELTLTGRGKPVRRRAAWLIRGRADLPDVGRVGVRLLPATEGTPIGAPVAAERLLGTIRKLHAANYYCYGYRRM
jgi:hypothetical protein